MPKNLLIIDDDKEFLKELKKLLESPDIIVTTCPDSIEGLAMIKKIIPDLLLLDVKMPDLTGIQLAAFVNLSQETKKIPIIIISGNVNQEEITDALKICHVLKYFSKPVDPLELINAVNSILSNLKPLTNC